VRDVGAGTGRVSLVLAAGGVTVVGLDSDASLLAALERRASGLPIETVLADARDFDLGRRFSLVLVPMQTLQLLGGRPARAAFLRRALAHLQPGARLAAALADAMDCFDQEHDVPPPPDACETAGVRYASRLTSVVEEDGRAAIHRRREIIGRASAGSQSKPSCGSTGSQPTKSRPKRRSSASSPSHVCRSPRPRSTSDRRWSCCARRWRLCSKPVSSAPGRGHNPCRRAEPRRFAATQPTKPLLLPRGSGEP